MQHLPFPPYSHNRSHFPANMLLPFTAIIRSLLQLLFPSNSIINMRKKAEEKKERIFLMRYSMSWLVFFPFLSLSFFHSPEPKINTASKQCYASILYGKYSALSSFYCNIIIYLNEIVLFYDKNILTLLRKEQYLKENKDEKKIFNLYN